MVSRLLLGCGTVGRAVVDGLRDRPGELTVLSADESRVKTLREEGIPARVCDFDAPEVLGEYDPDVVLVASDDLAANRSAVRAVRAAFPEAYVAVYARGDADLAALADEVVDPGRLLGERVLALTDGDAAGRPATTAARKFRTTLRSLSGPLAVVLHDNPDPDAIGAGAALATLAERTGLEATVCYFGAINHQENQAMVNLLDLDLRNLESPSELDAFESIALVDHSRPGVNDSLPPETPVDIVVDHHPPPGPIEASFVDLRQEVGATCTILVEYHQRLGARFDPDVATALLYGIRVDTDDFVREVHPADFQAAAALLAHADLDALERVESPSVSPDTFETIAAAVRDRRVEDTVVVTYAGSIASRDSLSQAADLLLGMSGIDTALVFGTVEDTVYASARSRGAGRDLGETMRAAFGRIGSAGGHAEMAGAQIPLGSLGDLPADDDRSRDAVIETVIGERFLETVRRTSAPFEAVRRGAENLAGEYASERDGGE